MRIDLWLLYVLIFTVISCNDEPSDDGTTLPFTFSDGFESDNLEQLFPTDGSRWTGIQQVNPINGENNISLSVAKASRGNTSLKLTGASSDQVLSKMDIEKGVFVASEGNTITIEADFYIESTGSLQDLFLLDLECCQCWDISVMDNQCPGIRLKLSGEEEYLSIERGKILNSSISQNIMTFPRDEWVTIKWSMNLTSDNSGMNMLYLNDQELINTSGQNMPNADGFRQEFAAHGINFELSDPLYYERIQIGITANPSPSEVTLYIDNVSITIE